MLEVRGLRVAYGPVEAVRGIDIEVGAGEAVALLGPNGAGKTSTLRAVSQLVAHSGVVSFDGAVIDGLNPGAVARSGLIHVPEGRHVFPTLTVDENLMMGDLARDRRARSYTIADVYDLFPALRSIRTRLGYALSGGEQQMVAIGRALVASPRMLLVDEPSLGLAPIVATTVFGVLREVAHSTPMLVIEQNTSHALAVCGRAYVLAGGRVVLSGSAAQLSDRSELLASFLGQHDAAASVQREAKASARALQQQEASG